MRTTRHDTARRWAGGALVLALFAVVGVGTLNRSDVPTDTVTVGGAVALPDEARRTTLPPEPPREPAVVVLCSDLSEHRVPVSAVSSRRRGALIDLHGSPYIVIRTPGAPPRLPSP
jgi:hypothetical protein